MNKLKIVFGFQFKTVYNKITVISRKMLTNLRVRVYEPEIFEKMVEPAALNCTLGEHSYKNDNPNDVKLSKLIQFRP